MFQALKKSVFLRLHRAIRIIEAESVSVENERIKEAMKHCGNDVGIWGGVSVSGADQMSLGDNVHIGANAHIRAEGGLTIGDNTHISRNLLLYTINHRFNGERVPYDDEYVKRPVEIGRNVWIGMNVCIVPGARIGDGAIVGMGTTVSGEVPEMSIIASQKWRVVGYRDSDHYTRCVADRAYGGPNGARYVSARR